MSVVKARLDALGRKPWYPTFAVMVVAISFVASLFSSLGVLALTIADRQQAEVREAERAAQLQCIDDRDAYAAKSSQTLRDVTQEWNDAVSAKSAAVRRLAVALADGFDGIGDFSTILVEAIANPTADGEDPDPEVLAAFLDATTKIQTTSPLIQRRAERVSVRAAELVTASENLRQAREDNPVVPAASEVCATGTFVPPKPAKS